MIDYCEVLSVTWPNFTAVKYISKLFNIFLNKQISKTITFRTREPILSTFLPPGKGSRNSIFNLSVKLNVALSSKTKTSMVMKVHKSAFQPQKLAQG